MNNGFEHTDTSRQPAGAESSAGLGRHQGENAAVHASQKDCAKNKFANKDLYSLLHETGIRMGRGPRQGLTVRPGQNKVLKTIEKYGGEIRQRDLLDILGIRAASLSELLRKLEDDGYVDRRRNEDNKTEIIVTLTERGYVSALESRLSEKERDEALFSCLSNDERTQLSTILQKLLVTWDAADPETEGARRERRWAENTAAQEEQREVNAALEQVSAEVQ